MSKLAKSTYAPAIKIRSHFIEISKIKDYKPVLGNFYEEVKNLIRAGVINEDFKFMPSPIDENKFYYELPSQKYRCPPPQNH